MDVRIWRAVGEPLVAGVAGGTLAGESVAVKDLFAVAGHAVGAGNPEYLAEAPVASVHAEAVRALLDAGASIRGIARTDEFAYSVMGANAHYGTPPNPRAAERLPGGSSSGPAAAVALGEASIGLGTDTAGSVRVPASWQGLWGLRTTHGVVSREGLLPLAPSFDAVGWLTRSADALRRTAEASIKADGTAGDEFVISPALVGLADAGVRAGGELVVSPQLVGLVDARVRAGDEFVVSSALVGMADAGVRAAFEEKVRGLGRLREVRLPEMGEAFAAFRTVQAAEAWRAHGAWVSSHPNSLGADVAARFAWAATVTAGEEAKARAALDGFRERAEETLGDAVLVLPTTPTAAPLRTADAAELDAVRAATITLTCLASILGRPAVSAPVLESEGAPVGLSLVGPRGSDLDLVARASGIANL